MFLLQIREALKDELSDDAIELFKTLERGFEELWAEKSLLSSSKHKRLEN